MNIFPVSKTSLSPRIQGSLLWCFRIINILFFFFFFFFFKIFHYIFFFFFFFFSSMNNVKVHHVFFSEFQPLIFQLIQRLKYWVFEKVLAYRRLSEIVLVDEVVFHLLIYCFFFFFFFFFSNNFKNNFHFNLKFYYNKIKN